MAALTYDVVMLVAVALGALWLRRAGQRGGAPFARFAGLPLAAVWILAVAAAVILGSEMFDSMRLLAHGIFAHGPIYLVAAAALGWRKARRAAWAAAGFAAALLLVAADAFLLEPTWIEVTRLESTSPKLSRPVTVVVLADIQTDDVGEYERSVLRRAMAERPDIVLLAGDYVHVGDPERRAEQVKRFRALLAEVGLAGALATVAVRGNVDPDGWQELFPVPPVFAPERTSTVEAGEIAITALGFGDSFDTRLRVPARDRFHIVVGHGPDFALGDVRADLLVAGHTHGGQVRLPAVGPLITLSAVPRSWAAGVTRLPGPDTRTLVVSRGVGMERGRAPRMRFLCRPEMVVITLRPG